MAGGSRAVVRGAPNFPLAAQVQVFDSSSGAKRMAERRGSKENMLRSAAVVLSAFDHATCAPCCVGSGDVGGGYPRGRVRRKENEKFTNVLSQSVNTTWVICCLCLSFLLRSFSDCLFPSFFFVFCFVLRSRRILFSTWHTWEKTAITGVERQT